ncbi:MAG TPA: 30S ribosomal protein S20 [Anaerolineales bacterium]|nr:30S ribosomal protein S20 [Anaerolineales bacterium]
MANIKSQIKRNRQNDKRRLRNRVYRGTARIAVKSARTNIDAGAPESQAELKKAISALDKAAEKGVIHKNNAARRKSRLMKAFGKMVPAKVEEPVKAESVAEPEAEKAAPRKRTAKAEPKAEAAAEPKAETKKAPAKKAAAKKEPAATPAKKPATAAKKPAAKK